MTAHAQAAPARVAGNDAHEVRMQGFVQLDLAVAHRVIAGDPREGFLRRGHDRVGRTRALSGTIEEAGQDHPRRGEEARRRTVAMRHSDIQICAHVADRGDPRHQLVRTAAVLTSKLRVVVHVPQARNHRFAGCVDDRGTLRDLDGVRGTDGHDSPGAHHHARTRPDDTSFAVEDVSVVDNERTAHRCRDAPCQRLRLRVAVRHLDTPESGK
jgi:hypothetical protein